MLLYFSVLFMYYICFIHYLLHDIRHYICDYNVLRKKYINNPKKLNELYYNVHLFFAFYFILLLLCLFFDILLKTILYLVISFIIHMYILIEMLGNSSVFRNYVTNKYIKFKLINDFLRVLIGIITISTIYYNDTDTNTNTINGLLYIIITCIIHVGFGITISNII